MMSINDSQKRGGVMAYITLWYRYIIGGTAKNYREDFSLRVAILL
jgi:hypothetical protein